MQKRVGLARAIATNPEIIFFDEPTTGLDYIMADVINDLIVDCVKDLGATALSITTIWRPPAKSPTIFAMISAGKIIWRGKVADLDHSGNSMWSSSSTAVPMARSPSMPALKRCNLPHFCGNAPLIRHQDMQ